MPYFNIARPDETGLVLAIGWSGQWAASFVRDAQTGLTVRAGMEHAHLTLHPGERIRTPSIVMLFYAGDRMRGLNLWRNFVLHHATPAVDGLPVNPPVAASGATIGFNNMTEANQIQAVTNVAKHRLPVDTYWVDAGWSTGGFPNGMGTLDPDPIRFPNGLKPLADVVHELGLKFLLWFEPERVMPGTRLRGEHPKWLLEPDTSLPVAYGGKARLLNLGNHKARAWLTRTISARIRKLGIDVYRHDCNIQPLFYWRRGEPRDRQGMTEIRYIEGLYAFFDALRRDHPQLLVDNCASGGRRLDVEMMRRSLPLWRSDYCWEPVGQQCMTYGLSYWLPLHGVGAVACDAYNFRSGMGANMSFAFDYYSGKAAFWPELSKRIEVYLRIRKLFGGDYYPLTKYSTDKTAWMAWQFDRPDLGAGLIQVFRRAESATASTRLSLRGLTPDARYQVTDVDAGQLAILKGSDLIQPGLLVTSPGRPAALLITYKLAQPPASTTHPGAGCSSRKLRPRVFTESCAFHLSKLDGLVCLKELDRSQQPRREQRGVLGPRPPRGERMTARGAGLGLQHPLGPPLEPSVGMAGSVRG